MKMATEPADGFLYQGLAYCADADIPELTYKICRAHQANVSSRSTGSAS